jgi:hypothetical protein
MLPGQISHTYLASYVANGKSFPPGTRNSGNLGLCALDSTVGLLGYACEITGNGHVMPPALMCSAAVPLSPARCRYCSPLSN